LAFVLLHQVKKKKTILAQYFQLFRLYLIR